MNQNSSVQQRLPAEKETHSAAERLRLQIDDALASAADRSGNDFDDLEARADRMERAARDLAVALRELAHERRMAKEEKH